MKVEEFFHETSQNLNREIKDVRKLATEAMKKQEKELMDKFSGEYDHVKNFMETNVANIKNNQNESHKKFSDSVKHIKQVCSNYF